MKARKQKRDMWPDPAKSPPVPGCKIVPMRMDHVDPILTIEQESFPVPWSRAAFEHDLTANDLAHYWTLFRDEEMIGYSGIWLLDRIAHLTTICIQRRHRRLGLGRWFLLETMRMGAELGAERFTLEVRESNRIAIDLYESVGYRVVGRRKNYYREIGEDALVMWTGGPPYEA
jgi:ribosomal-protein-alanine N-acetyltransferase